MLQNRVKDSNLKPVIIIALITAVSLFGDSMLYVVLPTHWKEVGLTSLIQVGILLSANRFIRLPLNPIISWLYRRVSVRNGLLVAVFIAGSTTLLYGLVDGFYPWLILRCIWGLAWSFFRLGAYFMILDLSTDVNRGHFMGTYNGLYRTGSLVGMLAGGFCVDLFGMSSVAIVFGILAFLTVPVVVLYVPNSRNRTASQEQRGNKRLVFKQPNLLWLLTSVFLVVMCLEGMFTASLSHIIDVRLYSNISMFGIVIGAATLAGVLQSIRWAVGPFLSPWFGKLSDGKRGRKPFLVGSLLLAACLMAIVNVDLSLSVWMLNLLAVLLVSSVLSTVMDALATDIAASTSKLKAQTMTLYVIVMDVGASFGPFFGYLSERMLGLSTAYWVSAIVLLLLSVKWAFSAKPQINIQGNSSQIG